MTRYLAPPDVRAFYDRFGRRQDGQAFYEDDALAALVDHSDLHKAEAVVEFGCGTGRFAVRLLRDVLPSTARYAGCDLSEGMIAIARERLASFGDRVSLWHCDPHPDLSPGRPPFDAIIATYVLDLMAPEGVAAFLEEAARCLEAGGQLCLVSLTFGDTPVSQLTSLIWSGIFHINPRLVGGCRPIDLWPVLEDAGWTIHWHRIVRAWGIPSEVVIATRS